MITRTIHPLPFEHLEPHRFEDMVRQLMYDFRNWKDIEPTGRLGADEGIDIRAIELVPREESVQEETDEEGEDNPEKYDERLWTMQCKREKAITPKKMLKIIDDAIPNGGEIPHGFVLAASCDFSTKTRNVFREEMRKKGVQEFYLWGKAELEDKLFLPQNDRLLFVYFGISLELKKKSLHSKLRGKLAAKRKLLRITQSAQRNVNTDVLIRDANDEHYHLRKVSQISRKSRSGYAER